MDIIGLISSFLAVFGSIPVLGKAMVVVVSSSLALVVVVNAFVAAWHSLVIALNAVSAVPGLSGLKNVADALKADEAIIDDFTKNKLLPFLSQISALPVPKK